MFVDMQIGVIQHVIWMRFTSQLTVAFDAIGWHRSWSTLFQVIYSCIDVGTCLMPIKRKASTWNKHYDHWCLTFLCLCFCKITLTSKLPILLNNTNIGATLNNNHGQPAESIPRYTHSEIRSLSASHCLQSGGMLYLCFIQYNSLEFSLRAPQFRLGRVKLLWTILFYTSLSKTYTHMVDIFYQQRPTFI